MTSIHKKKNLLACYCYIFFLLLSANLSIAILNSVIKKVFYFYYDGFKESTLGKKLLVIVFIKLIIMFLVLKLFFFKDFLHSKFDSDKDKGNYVIEQLTGNK